MLNYTKVTFFQDPFDSQSSLFEPATRLCLFEVEKSVVTVVLPSDSSVQIHCLLNGCVVEDVRKGTISAFPRFVLYCYAIKVKIIETVEYITGMYCSIAFITFSLDFRVDTKVNITLYNIINSTTGMSWSITFTSVVISSFHWCYVGFNEKNLPILEYCYLIHSSNNLFTCLEFCCESFTVTVHI